MGNSSFTELEISKFKEVSHKLGKNPSLVQAAGGNTSIKSDESMLIKASGTSFYANNRYIYKLL